MSDGELLLELTNEIMGRTAATAARAILPIIRRRELEAGEKVKAAAAKKSVGFLVGDPRKGIPLHSPTPHEIADAIQALDVTAIIGDSHD